MGIKFSHGNVHTSYTGFHEFRIRIAREAGIKLLFMNGYMENGESWNNITDGIKYLLTQHDTNGKLTINECKIVSNRLNELISNWNDNDIDKQFAISIIQCMNKAIECNELFRFN